MPSAVSRALYIGRICPGNMWGKGGGFFSLNSIEKKKEKGKNRIETLQKFKKSRKIKIKEG